MSILRAENITKIYPGTVALEDVSVSFDSGKVHAFVGKNGSGKSTLVKIFSGVICPEKGCFYLDDEKIDVSSPDEATEKGFATAYQEMSLIEGLSIAENILMGRLPRRGFLIDWPKAYKMAQELLDELKINLSAKTMVKNLSMWQRQMVEIVKAVSRNPKVLMLDEPTSALANNETKLLFEVIRELKKRDIIIIYISHRLQELWEIADECTVLRDGKLVGNTIMSETTHQQLIKMMFGDVTIKTRPSDLDVGENTVLEVNELTRQGCFKDISFKVKENEILGIAGMLGAGRTELLKSIFGADSFDSGEIIFMGETITKPTPQKMKKIGFALTPEDRKKEGVIQILSVRENLCVASLNDIAKGKFINKTKEAQYVKDQIDGLEIKVPSAEAKISSLSGGNQQKVVVGNWLNTTPKLMMFDEPSRGIDVNAKQQIFQIIWNQSRNGISSIMVSSELEELIEVCHRILVMQDGEIVDEVFPEDVTVDQLYALCMGSRATDF